MEKLLSLQERIECPRSFTMEHCYDLMCECGGVCDGQIYECCLWDKSFAEELELVNRTRKGE